VFSSVRFCFVFILSFSSFSFFPISFDFSFDFNLYFFHSVPSFNPTKNSARPLHRSHIYNCIWCILGCLKYRIIAICLRLIEQNKTCASTNGSPIPRHLGVPPVSAYFALHLIMAQHAATF